MTNETKPDVSGLGRAECLIETIEVQLGHDFNGKESTFLKRLLAGEIAEAVIAERERCARVADREAVSSEEARLATADGEGRECWSWAQKTAEHIADTIRAADKPTTREG